MGTNVIPAKAGIQKEKNGFRIKCGMTKTDCFAAPSVPLRMLREGSGRIYARVERKTSSLLPLKKEGYIAKLISYPLRRG